MTTALTEKLKDETKSGKVQLVLVDSPGVIGQRHARKFVGVGSDDKILGDPEKAIEKADHILYVHVIFAINSNILLNLVIFRMSLV